MPANGLALKLKQELQLKTKKLENLDLFNSNSHLDTYNDFLVDQKKYLNNYNIKLHFKTYRKIKENFGSIEAAIEYALFEIELDKENLEALKDLNLNINK